MTKTISACASAFYDLMAPSVTSKESFFAYVLGETAKLPYFDRSQCPDNDKLADFGTAIFRTYDDDGGVITAAVIREFLRLKWYGALVTVICRSLLNCNYGKHRYLGTKYDYAVEERYFDRFIEMSRFFEIGEAAIFPMLVHAQAYENADPSAAWARPASEYIYGACERGVAPTLEAVMRCSDCGGALERLCVYNEITVIESACYALLFMADVNKRELRRFLSAHKRIALKYVMQYFDDANAGVRETVIRVMLMFKQDETVRARLLTAYETETSLKLRRLINAECAITLRVDGIRSAEELDKAAHESKVRGASRKITLNLRYTDGKKMPRAACSYILGMFNSKSAMPAEKVALISVKGLLDPASLSRQCADFVALDGIGKYPAAAAFVFLFGEDDDAHELLLKLDISSQKPARRKLLLNLIGISGLTVCRKYLNLLRLDRRLKNAAMSALMLSCEVWGRSVMDVEEEFADDFGLDGEGNYVYNGDSAARLDDELNVVLYGKPNI
ncbi:MAG: hypothetical protein LBS99_04445, partial [Clostridiales bacterium]|nr:hypothetical protein [Clostridiales bacterium]